MIDRLEEFLKDNHAEYKEIMHQEAFTAQEAAAVMHVHGKELLKTVMVRADGRLVMLVLPADRKVDFSRVADFLDEREVRLAAERDFKQYFPDCEPGAEPPFGNLYSIETLADASIAGDKRVFFNAGNHHEAVEMSLNDYVRLVEPRVADISEHQ